jgi:hypothetical protein
MANDKKDDNASAPTRVREIRPAGKPASGEPTVPRAMTPQPSGSSAPTMIKGIGGATAETAQAGTHTGFDPIVGWLVITDGPGRGKAVDIFAGMNSLGRAPGQRIRVDFGDASISSEGAAFITFEPKRQTFHINHGGKANIVYLNDEAVLTPMPLVHSNTIAIGETRFRFIQLCGPDFSWEDKK